MNPSKRNLSIASIATMAAISLAAISCNDVNKAGTQHKKSIIKSRTIDTNVFTSEKPNWPNTPLNKDIMFGFCDSTGNYLLGQNTMDTLDGRYFAITDAGQPLPLVYIGKQNESHLSNGRQTQYNFSNTQGHVFNLQKITLSPNKTYVIVSDSFLLYHHPISLKSLAITSLDRAAIQRISLNRRRRIDSAVSIAKLGTFGRVSIAKFHNDTDKLVSLVVDLGNRFIYEDYLGDSTDEQSVWRVDDGDEFAFEAIGIIAAFNTPHGIELARTWGAAEGESAELLCDSLGKFISKLKSYRYWSPI